MSGDALSHQWTKPTGVSNVEVYRSKDRQVAKYVHEDGSETTIKTVSSCANQINLATGNIEPIEVDRNKFSVFVSASVGCPVGCKFCYLTTKKYPYHRLPPHKIAENVKEALSAEVLVKPELRKKYMKLSWMGMGDAFLLEPRSLTGVSYGLAEWAIGNKGYAFGLDGVDISTVYPRDNYGWPHQLADLNDRLTDRFRINPAGDGRSTVRLFYSLHGVSSRSAVIPLGDPMPALKELQRFRQWYGMDVILHHMFLDCTNDDDRTLDQIEVITREVLPMAELRILRFNECDGSPYKESKDFDELVKKYAERLPKIKYQISAGSEIKAACGQFLCLTKEIK